MNPDRFIVNELTAALERELALVHDEGGEQVGYYHDLIDALITVIEYYTPFREFAQLDGLRTRAAQVRARSE